MYMYGPSQCEQISQNFTERTVVAAYEDSRDQKGYTLTHKASASSVVYQSLAFLHYS